MSNNIASDSNSLESELSDVTIEINVDGVNDICSLWKNKINSINIDFINVENVFSSLTDLDIATSIVSELKNSLASASYMILSTNSIIKTAWEEQVNIDDSTYMNNSNNKFVGLSSASSYSNNYSTNVSSFDSSTEGLNSSIDNSSLDLTINGSVLEEKGSDDTDEFRSIVNILLSIKEKNKSIVEYLDDSSYANLLKETILESSTISEEFRSFISSIDAESLQLSLKKIVSRDTSVTNASRNVLYNYLEQIVRENDTGIQNIDVGSFAKDVNDMHLDVDKIVYDEFLQQRLLDIYDGNNMEGFSSSGIVAIREIVTSLANDKNMTAEGLLLNLENKQFIVDELEDASKSFMLVSNLAMMNNDVAFSIINSIVN